jgi:hypothetical protein
VLACLFTLLRAPPSITPPPPPPHPAPPRPAAHPPPAADGAVSTVYVGNLPASVDEYLLMVAFAPFGPITHVQARRLEEGGGGGHWGGRGGEGGV